MTKKRKRFSFLILLIIPLVLLAIFSYFNTFKLYFSTSPNETVLVSFKIDDINFAKNQKIELQNALVLARKYNITFDLGVMAQSFNDNADPETFKIYQDNQDVFEIVAHGFTHNIDSVISQYEDIPYGDYGEFGIVSINNKSVSIPLEIQEEHIKKMKEIFQKNNLAMANKIFIAPYHTGDENTIILAEKYGYKLIVQQLTNPKTYSEQDYGKIIATQNYIDLPIKDSLSNTDLANYDIELNKAISLNQTGIDISLHPINFYSLTNIDYFFKELINQRGPRIKFGMISERFQ